MRLFLALFLLATAGLSLGAQKFSAFSIELGVAKEQFVKGNLEAALAAVDRADQAAPPTVETQDLRGCIYFEQGKYEDAAKAFEAGHAIQYDAFAPRIHSADVLLAQKKFKDAAKEYERLIEVKAPMWPDYARFGLLMANLGDHDEPSAKRVLATILFPSETPAYYYAQAAWAFAYGKKSEAQKWISSAQKIFDASKTAWYDRKFYQLGWIKKKPAPAIDRFL